MMKRYFALPLLLLICLFAAAQEARPIIRFTPFVCKGIGSEEIRFIESLIQSYISDVGELVYYPDNIPPDVSLSTDGLFGWNRSPDYVLSGSIHLEGKTRIFTLEFRNIRTNEIVSSTTAHKTPGDLALRAQALVENIYKPARAVKEPVIMDEAETGKPETITENSITGIWRGEPGTEMIRLQAGGLGTAFFSSGARMNLKYTIENNTIRINQISPNNERFYYPYPPEIARQLADIASPMHWELQLYSGGTRIRGIRFSTEVKSLVNGSVVLSQETGMDTFWVRVGP